MVERKDVEVKPKGFAGMDGASIEMPGAEDKRARPVGKAAGSVAGGRRFEDASVWTGFPDVTRPGIGAMRDARDFPEDHSSKAPPQNVRGFARRKEERLLSDELEP